ncbi:MAG: hypothetical protein H6696_14165 [Deferribacteres bacterium]|nr:hypothetical protein [candidate division KSB1 bacterium]MCB9503073.1 hypothetical protein [Deferribacteres bacterium]
MVKTNTRIIDVVSTDGTIKSVESISMNEIENLARQRHFEGSTLVVLPSDCPVIIHASRRKSSTLQMVSALNGRNENNDIIWIQFEALYLDPEMSSKEPWNSVRSPVTNGANKTNKAQAALEHRQLSSEDAMTTPQRRYLFRLLAEQGLSNGKIEDYLLNYFQVTSMKSISKQDASHLIENLLNEGGG